MRNSRSQVGMTVAMVAAAILGLPGQSFAQPDVEQPVVVSTTPVTWTPSVLDNEVSAIAVVGNTTVIGGTFTGLQAVGGLPVARPYIAAFDSTTGALIPGFAPNLNGRVNSLDVVGDSVVVGGEFTLVNGVASRGITRLSIVDGARVAGFAATLDNGRVNSIAVHGNNIYFGGRFTKVNGVTRSGIAVVDATTGVLGKLNVPVGASRMPSQPDAAVSRLALSPDGATLLLGGNFMTVGGLARNQLAMVSTATGKVTSWSTTQLAPICNPSDFTSVNDIAFSPDGAYFALVTTGGPYPNTLCDTSSRWETARSGGGQLPTWVDSTGGDTLTAVAVTGTAVYVGGHQRWMNNSAGSNSAGPGAVARDGIAALDPMSGVPLAWNPGLQRDKGVGDFLATATGLWIGFDAEVVGGTSAKRIAFMPVAGGTKIPGAVANTLPNSLFVGGSDASLNRRSFDGATFGASAPVADKGNVPWDQVRGAFMVGGQVFYGTPDGKFWAAPFDGSTVGTPIDAGTWFDFSSVQGMTFDSGRLYYVTGDGKLYYRWFSPSSRIVGSQEFIAAATGFLGARSMFAAGGSMYFANSTSHVLNRVALVNGIPSGVPVAISGPALDGITWDGTAAFLSSNQLKPFERIFGSDRLATALAVSEHRYSAGSAGAVVLARSDAFPDGLASTPLAVSVNAPLLLNPVAVLDARVRAEILRVLPPGGTVYFCGGTGALGVGVENAVKALGYATVRLGGADRYATSVAIAAAVPGATKILLATGDNFPDALGAGAAAASSGGVVVLTRGAVLTPSVVAYLDAHPTAEVWGIGGPAAAAAGSRITDASRAIIGATRYDTATTLASAFFPTPASVGVVSGINFPDGLSAGPEAARRGGPVLLSPTAVLPSVVSDYLVAHASTLISGFGLGGPLVLTPAVINGAATSMS